MSTPTNDGGPAFPFGQVSELTGQPINGFFSPGMTLRDWFAGHVDVPWNASLDTLTIKYPDRKGKFTLDEIATFRAEMRFREADALLVAREKGST